MRNSRNNGSRGTSEARQTRSRAAIQTPVVPLHGERFFEVVSVLPIRHVDSRVQIGPFSQCCAGLSPILAHAAHLRTCSGVREECEHESQNLISAIHPSVLAVIVRNGTLEINRGAHTLKRWHHLHHLLVMMRFEVPIVMQQTSQRRGGRKR